LGRVRCLAVAGLLVAVACDEAGSREGRQPSGGKADDADQDAGAGALGPCEAQRVMQFVNRSDAYALAQTGLDEALAGDLVAHRAGYDGRTGTKDDAPFYAVDELKAIAGPGALGMLVAAAEDALPWRCASPIHTAETLRIVAANLTSGRNQTWDEGPGNRILETLQPDVVLLQEVRYQDGSSEAMQAWMDATLGEPFEVVYGTGDLPNGIASRYPILDWGVWTDTAVDNRDFVWARIDIPGDRNLWAVSVHLLTKGGDVRAAQAQALLDYVENEAPADDWLVIGGDFNTRHHDEEALHMLGAVVTTEGPYPVDTDGNMMTNSTRRYPYDFVFVDPSLAELAAVTEQGTSFFPLGLVVDTRTYDPIGDLAPAQPDDSAAFQMQHMAVVRDFALP
jgi:endonuclease/exonuclease/phosphatase family metal-dependent hydrolase